MKARRSQFLASTALIVVTTSTAALAQVGNEWTGAVSSDWNEAGNWSLGTIPSNTADPTQHAVINITPANIATISSNLAFTPVDIIVGSGAGSNGTLLHTSGNASTGDGNWMFVGTNGGTGSYDLSGDGNLNVNGRLYVGGNGAGGSIGTATIETTGTVTIGSFLQVGTEAGSTGVVNLNAGDVTTNGWTEFGNFGGDGTLNMAGGSLVQSGDNPMIFGTNGATGAANISGGNLGASNGLWIGNGGDSNGSLDLSAGTINKTGGDHFVVGREGGTGLAEISGGALNVNNEIWIGQNGGSVGILEISGGTITNNSWVAIGRSSGQGTVNMTGGTWNKTGESNFIVGASGGGITSTMNMSGGVVNVEPDPNADRGITWIGEQDGVTGVLNLSGTAEFNSEQMILAANGGSNGLVNLNGGTLRTSQLAGGDGNAAVSFNGTQIVATADRPDFITNLDVASIGDGGLSVDTQEFNVGSDQSFTGTGGITKTGSGTLTLSGTNTYSGATTVSGGTLAITSFTALGASTTIQVAEGAAFDITAAGNLVLGAGETLGGGGTLMGNVVSSGQSVVISPGESPGTLTIAGDFDASAGATFDFELGNFSDLLAVTGQFTGSGPGGLLFNFSDSGGVSAGTIYDLITFGSSANLEASDFTAASLPAGWELDETYGTGGWLVDGDSASVRFSAIPEPSAAMLGLLGAAFLLRRRR